jgi:hypothetical protein
MSVKSVMDSIDAKVAAAHAAIDAKPDHVPIDWSKVMVWSDNVRWRMMDKVPARPHV